MPRLHTEKTAKMFHDMKPFSHDMKPVYNTLVQTNMLKAMTKRDRIDIHGNINL